MLENPRLLLRPWTRTADGQCRAAIENGAERIVGWIRGQRPSWRMWRSYQLEVCEANDMSLLLTIRKSAGLIFPVVHVEDADEQPLGQVGRVPILDPFGQVYLRADGPRRLRTREGHVLASWDLGPDALRLDFVDVAENHPFARMLILAHLVWVWVRRAG